MREQCLIFECDNTQHGRGICHKHYEFFRRNGFPDFVINWSRPEKVCKKENCDNKHFGKGYCRKHYIRYWRYGSPDTIKKKGTAKNKCKIEGCDKWCHGKGYCQNHYAINRKYGNPTSIRQVQNHNRNPFCVIEGCNVKHFAMGYCLSHYRKISNPRKFKKDDLTMLIAKYNVRMKYNNQCQWYKCKNTPLEVEIHVHHIFPVSEYPELKYLEEYMILYCKDHHAYWHQMRGDFYHKLIMNSNGVI